MRLVIMESPYAGDVAKNVEYGRACLRDALQRGDAPIASHLLYTQPGVLDDTNRAERAQGIAAGLAWAAVAQASVVYVDHGISEGMAQGIKRAADAGIPVEYRSLDSRGVEPDARAPACNARAHADTGSDCPSWEIQVDRTNGVSDAITDVDALARLRRILRLLGLENAVPADDATLGAALFPVFGQIASAIERVNSAPAVAWKTTHRAVCVPLTEDREIAEQWRDNGYPVTEFFTRPSVARAPAAKPATWPDEDTMKFAMGAANSLGAISMAQVEAIVRAVQPFRDARPVLAVDEKAADDRAKADPVPEAGSIDSSANLPRSSTDGHFLSRWTRVIRSLPDHSGENTTVGQTRENQSKGADHDD